MTWTEQNATEAAAQGWGVYVVCEGAKVDHIALPVGPFTKQAPHAPAILQAIRISAQQGNALALAALRTVTGGRR